MCWIAAGCSWPKLSRQHPRSAFAGSNQRMDLLLNHVDEFFDKKNWEGGEGGIARFLLAAAIPLQGTLAQVFLPLLIPAALKAFSLLYVGFPMLPANSLLSHSP